MSNQRMPASTNKSVTEAERRRRNQRMAKRMEDPLFREHVKTIRQSIIAGVSFSEARERLPKVTEPYWNDIKFAISKFSISPENILLEWQIRNQSRYQQAVNLYNEAFKSKDLDMMSRAIMMLQKIDEADIDLKKEFGLIRPIVFEDERGPGEGISDQDVNDARQRFELELKQRILDKLALERDAHAPVTIDVLTRTEITGQADSVGLITVAGLPVEGHKQQDSIQEGVTDGGVDLLHTVDAVALPDGTSTEGPNLLATEGVGRK